MNLGSHSTSLTVAYFVSPHGYGHAARASAVMAAMRELDPAIRFEIFTRVPPWFFEASLPIASFGYHAVLTDIGLVQETSLLENLPETVQRLDEFLPFDPAQIELLVTQVKKLGCRLVLCDIAPMGIAVAREAGLPSVLVENFTWDWIYEGYLELAPGLRRHTSYLRQIFEAARYHVQAAPICVPRPVDLKTGPISRKLKDPPGRVRQKLGIPGQVKAVLLTMGGVPWHYTFLEQLAARSEIHFIMPVAGEQVKRQENLLFLPHRSNIFHPDVVNACDAVIGKIGYSTVAEVYQAGVPFGYVARPRFRESEVLAGYIEREMYGLPVDEARFQDGAWLALLPELLALPRIDRNGVNGADEVAAFAWNIGRGEQ